MTGPRSERRCPNGHAVGPTDAYCPTCGTALPPAADAGTRRAERPERKARSWHAWTIAFLAVVVVLAGVAIGTAYARATRPARTPAARPSPSTSGQPSEPSSTPSTIEPTSAPATPPAGRRVEGYVDYTAVTDSRAPEVAHTLNGYFAGINTKEPQLTSAVLDPRNPLGHPPNWAEFVHGVSTTTDSDITLHAVTGGAGQVTADVTFRSTQSPGYGPAGNEQETCTRWNTTFTLSEPSPRQYLILSASSTHTSC